METHIEMESVTHIGMETQHEKVTNLDPPKPQKLWFYYGKTHVFKDPTYPLKVTKITSK